MRPISLLYYVERRKRLILSFPSDYKVIGRCLLIIRQTVTKKAVNDINYLRRIDEES